MSFFQQIVDSPLAHILAVWQDARATHDPPLKRDIDPTRFAPAVLPDIFMYELCADGRLRCRLCGTGVARNLARDITGRYLEDIVTPEAYATRMRMFRQVLEGARPMVYLAQMAIAEREYIPFRALMTPVSRGGNRCDVLLCGMERLSTAPLPVALEPPKVWFAGVDDLARLAASHRPWDA
jgi:hypothetical protein